MMDDPVGDRLHRLHRLDHRLPALVGVAGAFLGHRLGLARVLGVLGDRGAHLLEGRGRLLDARRLLARTLREGLRGRRDLGRRPRERVGAGPHLADHLRELLAHLAHRELELPDLVLALDLDCVAEVAVRDPLRRLEGRPERRGDRPGDREADRDPEDDRGEQDRDHRVARRGRGAGDDVSLRLHLLLVPLGDLGSLRDDRPRRVLHGSERRVAVLRRRDGAGAHRLLDPLEPRAVRVEIAAEGRDLPPLRLAHQAVHLVEVAPQALLRIRPLARVLRLRLGVADVEEEVLLEPPELERLGPDVVGEPRDLGLTGEHR